MNSFLGFKATTAEVKAIKQAAAKQGKPVSKFIRDTLNKSNP